MQRPVLPATLSSCAAAGGRWARRLPLLAAALALTACASMSTPKDVSGALASDPQFSTLAKLVQDAGLGETLKGAGPYTVFAPTNDAFKAVPAKTMETLAKDPKQLKAVLAYHVVPAKLAAADVKQGNVKSVQGANLALARAGEFVTVDDAMVSKADIPAGNGVVHAIDRVLMPPK